MGGVLIADGDSERGRRIADACSELGLATRVVTHGAAALEMALAERPGVLIVQLGLPLIAGEQLGEILLTNPQTGSVRLVFLTDTTAEAARQGLKGLVIPPPARADEVSRIAQRMLESPQPTPGADVQRPAAGGVEADGVEADGVEGQLSQLSLADLVQLFHVSQKTGVVELSRDAGDGVVEKGSLMLRGGDVIHAETGSAVGEKALYRLLDWDRGKFVFRSIPASTANAQTASLDKPTRALIREGLRQAQERARLTGDLPPPDAQVRLKIRRASLPIVIHPLTQEVLLVLEAYSQVDEVVDHCSFPDYQVLRTLRTLIDRGMVEMSRGSTLGPTASSQGLFSAARGARLREWLAPRRRVSQTGVSGPTDAKLLVVASDASAARGFARLVANLPGAALRPASLGESTPTTEATTVDSLGRLAVNSEVGIEFLQVPSDERYAPLWPIAGHGALGILFVLSSPVTAGLEAVRGAAEVLTHLPRARVFHLLLLEKEGGVEPDALRENLSLFDESALFLIPLANTTRAKVLLREMFVRILP